MQSDKKLAPIQKDCLRLSATYLHDIELASEMYFLLIKLDYVLEIGNWVFWMNEARPDVLLEQEKTNAEHNVDMMQKWW